MDEREQEIIDFEDSIQESDQSGGEFSIGASNTNGQDDESEDAIHYFLMNQQINSCPLFCSEQESETLFDFSNQKLSSLNFESPEKILEHSKINKVQNLEKEDSFSEDSTRGEFGSENHPTRRGRPKINFNLSISELYQKILKFLEKEMERIEKEIDQPGNSIIKKRKRDDKPRTKIVRL